MKPQQQLILSAVVAAIVAGGIGFGLGRVTAPKSATVAASGTQNGGPGAPFGGTSRRGGRPVFGTVTSVSGTALVITDQSGATHNVVLSSSTTYTSGQGEAATVADVKAGVSVAAFGTAATDGTVTATRVAINPSFGGGAANGAPATQ